jgi:hypothetical protein
MYYFYFKYKKKLTGYYAIGFFLVLKLCVIVGFKMTDFK